MGSSLQNIEVKKKDFVKLASLFKLVIFVLFFIFPVTAPAAVVPADNASPESPLDDFIVSY